MRTHFTVFHVARLGLIALLPITLAAAQDHLPKRGQRVYVVAVRDTRGLTCGPICFQSVPDRRALLDRVAPDGALQSATVKEFRKQGRYVLADSAENADFVFIIEGYYGSLFAEKSKTGGIHVAAPLDQKPDRLFQVSAIAVPASIYREAPADWQALFRARLWGAGEGRVIVDSSAGTGGGTVRIDAMSEHLVRMFSGKEVTPLSLSLNLCIHPSQEQADIPVESPAKSSGAAPSTASQPGQKIKSGDPSIKVDVDFVSVPVSASDVDGKYIPDLKMSDFHIFEDDVEQEVDRLVPVSEPVNAVLLMDSSLSMPLNISQVRQSALSFVGSMRPADRSMVVSFEDRVHVDCEFTSDRLELRRAILATKHGDGAATRLYDAVDLVLTERLDPLSGRKAIVLFTDGVDTSSWLADSASTLSALEESNVILYAVQFETNNNQYVHFQPGWTPVIVPPGMAKNEEMHAYGSQYLQDLTSRSGGRFFHAATMDNAVEAFAQVADELRHQYVLGYYPSNRARDGSYRRIHVTVDRPGVRIRARGGYLAGTRPSGK